MNDHVLCIGISLLLGIATGALGVVFAALEMIHRAEADAAHAAFRLGLSEGRRR